MVSAHNRSVIFITVPGHDITSEALKILLTMHSITSGTVRYIKRFYIIVC